MKLSISNIAWAAENDNEMYGFLQQVGFAGLEIAPTRIFPSAPYDNLEAANKWAIQLKEEYGLAIPSMQSIWYGHSEKIFGSEAERQSLTDYTKKAVDFAEAIGCPNLVFGNPKNRDTDDVERDLPVAIDFFRQIGDYAALHHTTIAIEPNPTIYNTRFVNRTEQAAQLVEQVGSEGIRVNVDLGTIIYNEEEIAYLRQIPHLINHVHISEPYLNLIENRELHKQLFDILNELHYDRFVSIEMGNKGNLEQVKEIVLRIDSINHQ